MCFLNFFFIFLTFYIRQAGPRVIYLLLSISTGLGALIYALINALKKLTHCINALKKLTP